jgi:hypothetical protein
MLSIVSPCPEEFLFISTAIVCTWAVSVNPFFYIFMVSWILWMRANATIKTNAVLAGTLHYEVSEECIRVTQGEESGELPWDAVYKIVSNDKQVLIYSNRVNAYIIPRTQIGEQYDMFCRIAEKKLEKFRLKLKK